MKTQDLRDINEYIEKNSKWYWYIPLIGFFAFQIEMTQFALQSRMVVDGGSITNDNYEYVQMDGQLKYRSAGLDAVTKKYKKVHMMTLGISLILLLTFEIFLFNIAPFLMKSSGNKVINENM